MNHNLPEHFHHMVVILLVILANRMELIFHPIFNSFTMISQANELCDRLPLAQNSTREPNLIASIHHRPLCMEVLLSNAN